MGGFMVLLLQAVAKAEATNRPLTTDDIDNLPAFVFGDDGEFLGRVDVPVLTGSKTGN
jgi:hypothetical protein